ncbi:transcription factor 15 [Drosophila mojavensis]|uniref:BHLH domain-containing protein n=1 Tax=Drosophila mojavensis TaxID=7230 RepID=B4L2Z6_DROMO|nr:transcription factor 15 [Drosophila mojavensis]EDW07882.1 uncharacterized protein Dmoj_GI15998 [Drosophila mojavensis]
MDMGMDMGMNMGMDMDMDRDININININASETLEFSTYLLSSFAGADSNGSGSNVGADSEDSLIGHTRRQAPPRQKINARERHRTFNVNAAYEALRGLIPTEPVNRKLSKIEIIHLASSYITHLSSTLHAGTDRQPCLRQKWEHKCENDGNRAAERVNICTFCMRPKFSQSTRNVE